MIQTMRRFAAPLLAGCLIACAALLGGCSSGTESSASSASSASDEFESVAEEQQDILILGQDEPGALSITFTNEMGAAITDIALLPVGSTAEPQFLMTADQEVEDDGQVRIYQQPGDSDGLFDVVLKCGDAQYTLHGVNLQTTDAATLHRQGDIAYLDTTIDGNVVSTLREETDIAAEAAAAEQAVDEAAEEAIPTVADEQPLYYDDGSTGGTDAGAQAAPTYDSTPSTAPSQAPAQGEDSCVGDVILR